MWQLLLLPSIIHTLQLTSQDKTIKCSHSHGSYSTLSLYQAVLLCSLKTQFVWCCKLVTTNQLNNRCKLSCRFTGFKCPPLSILHMCANYVKDMQRLKPTSSQVPRHVSIVWKHFGFEMDDSGKLFTGSGTICKLCRQKVAHDESATN